MQGGAVADPVEVSEASEQYVVALTSAEAKSEWTVEARIDHGRLTIREAGIELGVHENTVRNWIDRGLLRAARLPSGHRRLEASEVRRLQAGILGSLAPDSIQLPDALPDGFIPATIDPTNLA